MKLPDQTIFYRKTHSGRRGRNEDRRSRFQSPRDQRMKKRIQLRKTLLIFFENKKERQISILIVKYNMGF